MNEPANPVLAEVWRGPVLECVHRGTAVVCRPDGEIVAAWGDPARRILPRSSCKMVQALPLVESGAADAAGLTDRHLALACASHNGADVHTGLATDWLASIGLDEGALRCGPQMPSDTDARLGLECHGRPPGQIHNHCSGKHSGMLTLGRHLGAAAAPARDRRRVRPQAGLHRRADPLAAQREAGSSAGAWADHQR